MPLATLRARASEVMRIIAEARVITRAAFDPMSQRALSSREAAERVGSLLDAAQRLLPGMAPLSERSRPRDSSLRRVTMRGGPDRALGQIERAALLESILEEAHVLFTEIERGRSSAHFLASEPPPSMGDGARSSRRS
jgi:hypothetical protein